MFSQITPWLKGQHPPIPDLVTFFFESGLRHWTPLLRVCPAPEAQGAAPEVAEIDPVDPLEISLQRAGVRSEEGDDRRQFPAPTAPWRASMKASRSEIFECFARNRA